MNIYEKVPTEFLIEFYYEMMKNIEKGILSKNMYYELGLIRNIAFRRGLRLGRPDDFEQVVTQADMDEFIRYCS